MRQHNFDAASGLPMHPAARAALDAALERGWADPTRTHRPGRLARQLLDAARASVAQSLGARPEDVVFTSSGTNAIHLGMLGLARARQRVGDRVVAGAVEHTAVLRAADWLSPGTGPSLVAVDQHGLVDAEQFAAELARPGVALAALQQVNHEVGTCQPVGPVHQAARERGIPLLVDACAGVGQLPVPGDWDVLAASAHKWGGPAGVGVLAVRPDVRWRTPLPQDEAERGRVAGFPAVPAIVAAATALEVATRTTSRADPREALVARLRREVPSLVPQTQVLGPDRPRAPHIVSFTFLYATGDVLVEQLDRAGFAVNSGSACSSDTRRPSHVLAAMGAITHGNLRVSLPPDCQPSAIDDFLAALPAAVAQARSAADEAAGP